LRPANTEFRPGPERRSESRGYEVDAHGTQRPPCQAAGGRFRVASYNIHLGIGRDGRFDPERVARVLAEVDADVVCLQEVARERNGFDMLAFLAETTGLQAIAGPTLLTQRGDYGNAILTRLWPSDVQRWDLSIPGREPRGAIAMHAGTGSAERRFIATHLGLRPAERRRQIRMLLGFMHETGALPTILMGDVNEWFLWGRPLRWLHRHFERAPSPATYPAGFPLFALDRIWSEPRSALCAVATHASQAARLASDHLPITAEVDFEAGPGVNGPLQGHR
jgi:endonuclease/exonuclease/phosphatase family metal-dependent hydrolase